MSSSPSRISARAGRMRRDAAEIGEEGGEVMMLELDHVGG
jgi:hypothetical protein